MATKPDQTAIDDAEFTAAFNEDQTGPREQTEDEAFSELAESGTSDASTEGDVVTVGGDGKPEGEATDATPADAMADAGADPMGGEPGEGATTETNDAAPADQVADAGAEGGEEEPTDPKELQRKKSWEGRLRAREEELRLREEALAGKKTEAAESGYGAADGMESVGEKIEAAADAVESGEMTPEQALKTLEEDFGPEFVKMMSVIIGAKASEAVDSRVGEVSKTIDQLIGEIVDDKAREHFEAIAERHPDFNEINGSEKFSAYLASMSDEERAKAEKIATDGSARQINKLLDGYKTWAGSQGGDKAGSGDQAAAPAGDAGDEGGMGMTMGSGIDESAADAAEGVRSTGMSLPSSPDKDESYEAAWSKF